MECAFTSPVRTACRLSSDPAFPTFLYYPTFSYIFFKIPTLSYFFVLVNPMLFQNAMNYCYSVCITCNLYDYKGQYFTMISQFGAEYDLIL